MYITVGRVKDAHGIKGEIFVRLKSGESHWLDELPEVRLQKSTEQKPQIFSIERARRHKGGIVFQLKEVKDRNHAETLKGFDFLIPEELLISEPGEAIFLHEILGFEVVDEILGSLGPIKGFSTNGAQDLLVLNRIQNGKEVEVLVPFVKAFILQMDFKERKLLMNLPTGLVE